GQRVILVVLKARQSTAHGLNQTTSCTAGASLGQDANATTISGFLDGSDHRAIDLCPIGWGVTATLCDLQRRSCSIGIVEVQVGSQTARAKCPLRDRVTGVSVQFHRATDSARDQSATASGATRANGGVVVG